MKSVTTAFQNCQARPGTKPITRVYFKRRYWNGSNAYTYETSWTEIDQSEVIFVDPVIHQFDNQNLNEFRVTSGVLRFRNDKMQWKEGTHTDSKLKPDGVSSFGYEPYLMKFQIRTGFEDVGSPDIREGKENPNPGADELVTIFTGLATEFWTDSDSRIMYIRLIGLEEFLVNADASRVSTTVSAESIGTGDGIQTEFFTAHNGVGKITTVTVNAVTLNPGTDYTISNLNQFMEPAQIEFAQPPASGYAITCTYNYWKKNKTVEQLISDLVTEAGITSTSIDNATLGTVSNNITMSSKADFDAGVTTTGNETALEPGSIIPAYRNISTSQLWNDFASGTLADSGWEEVFYSPDPVVFDVNGGELRYGIVGSDGFIRRGFNGGLTQLMTLGTWQMKVKISHANNWFNWQFMAYQQDSPNTWQGYSVSWGGGGSNGGDLIFKKSVVGVGNTTLATVSGTSMSTGVFYTVKITRDQYGTFRVYIDGVLKITVQDTEVIFGDRSCIDARGGDGTAGKYMFFDDIYIPSATFAITHESQSIDTVGGLTAWGNLSVGYEIEGTATLTITTRTSTDDSSYDAYQALTSTNGIQSAVKRYIRVRLVWSIPNGQLLEFYDGIRINYYTVQFTSTRVFVAMGNFFGKDCYQAIQELAKLTDFEWGVNDDETFFFRSRTVSATPDATFENQKNLLKITSLTNGYDWTFSIFRAQFGNFVAEKTSSADVRTSALEIYGRRMFEISSDILINEDTNLADALATVYKNRLEVKRRRLHVLAKYWPQIELSDTLSITFAHEPIAPPNVQNPGLELSVPEPMLNGFIGKVIMTQHDPQNFLSEFELEEVV